jgi:hypothetical protein
MFLDEVEYLRKADTQTHGDIMRILNSGYQASGNVKRAGKNDTVKEYSTYSPKMFAGINELTDTLDQRSISIRMVRALGHETVERYNGERSDILELHTRLRNKLYVFGLEYAATCAGLYGNLPTNAFMADVFNRKADLWGPLFVVAQLADESRNDGKTTHQESLKSYLDFEERLHARADEEENITRSLALAMKEVLKWVPAVSEEGAEAIFPTDLVYDFVSKHPDFRGKLKSVNKLTSILAEKLEVKVRLKTIEGRTTRCYVINRDRLNDEGLRANAWTQDDLDRETQTTIRTTVFFA